MSVSNSIEKYCQYQERCHREVRNKLYELGCSKSEVEFHLAEMIAKNLVNEERYARAVARGKFRMMNWGRNKIVYKLRSSQVSPYCIRKALSEIDPDEYQEVLRRLARKKYDSLSGKKELRKLKTYNFLFSRGYEADLINEVLKEIADPTER